jgi:hypothetical protein
LRGKRLALRVALIAILAALLGASAAVWRLSGVQAAQERSNNIVQIRLRCLMHWQYRSGVADAEFEFRKGRRGLLQAMKSFDPAYTLWTPGLNEDATAEVREDYPVVGPTVDDLDLREVGAVAPLCEGETRYAWDYNVTMLRLLGRERDVQLPYLSPELPNPPPKMPERAVARPQ